MQTNTPELLQLQHAALRAAIFAFNPIKVGDRVTWLEGDGTQHYGTVHVMGESSSGVPMAGLRVAGQAWMWCEPVDNLAKVCGVCRDCRALNQRPGCLHLTGARYWTRYEQAGRVIHEPVRQS